ncbi:MAG: T9SS type A sorting domain-containing protein [Bacteroidota bacterium]
MRYFAFFLIFISVNCFAQFAPPAGQAGTTAIDGTSSVFVNWANACTVTRGYVNVSNTSAGFASTGLASSACGKALESGTLSLGDGGSAILTFPFGIMNGSGADFAVFENSFSDDFLELAFVEVSSDGTNYFRFPATSNTQVSTQVGTFDLLDATKLNNLAGKYRAGYGTPFDLEELKNEAGLDVNKITHIKIIDVVGSINATHGTKDENDNLINDPFPTEFAAGGFDLDAIGVINQNAIAGFLEQTNSSVFSCYPNPANSNSDFFIETNLQSTATAIVYNALGSVVFENEIKPFTKNELKLNAGIYFIHIVSENHIFQTQKLIVNE